MVDRATFDPFPTADFVPMRAGLGVSFWNSLLTPWVVRETAIIHYLGGFSLVVVIATFILSGKYA